MVGEPAESAYQACLGRASAACARAGGQQCSSRVRELGRRSSFMRHTLRTGVTRGPLRGLLIILVHMYVLQEPPNLTGLRWSVAGVDGLACLE